MGKLVGGQEPVSVKSDAVDRELRTFPYVNLYASGSSFRCEMRPKRENFCTEQSFCGIEFLKSFPDLIGLRENDVDEVAAPQEIVERILGEGSVACILDPGSSVPDPL